MGHGVWTAVRRGLMTELPNLKSLSRLWPVQIRNQSPCTLSKPRSRNCRNPRPCLIWPKTGSTVAMRNA